MGRTAANMAVSDAKADEATDRFVARVVLAARCDVSLATSARWRHTRRRHDCVPGGCSTPRDCTQCGHAHPRVGDAGHHRHRFGCDLWVHALVGAVLPGTCVVNVGIAVSKHIAGDTQSWRERSSRCVYAMFGNRAATTRWAAGLQNIAHTSPI